MKYLERRLGIKPIIGGELAHHAAEGIALAPGEVRAFNAHENTAQLKVFFQIRGIYRRRAGFAAEQRLHKRCAGAALECLGEKRLLPRFHLRFVRL